MSFLGFRERLQLRRAIVDGVNSGQLPQSSLLVLQNSDAFFELERQVYSQAQSELASGWQAAGATPAGPASQHPILAWIVSHAPQILQFVLAILPLFGVNVPPITIPGLPTPGTPTPTPSVPGGAADDPTASVPHSSAANPTMPADFALPPALIALTPLVEQLAAQVLASVLPQIEAKVQDWVKLHLSGGAASGSAA